MLAFRPRALLVAAIAAALAGCPLGGSSSTTMATGTSAPVGPTGGAPTGGGGDGQLTVPDLIGRTPDEARAIVKAAGFASEPESTRPVECEGAPKQPGRINCQDPEPGKLVARYAMIQVNVYQVHRIAGAIVRSQLETLKGLSPDQAKQALQKMGHDGKVSIGEVTSSGGGHAFLKDCGQNKVCATSGESGIGIHDDLTLYINPTLTIAPPP